MEKTGVVTVPGESFGSQGNIRFSYATSDKTIMKAMDLVKKALKQKKLFMNVIRLGLMLLNFRCGELKIFIIDLIQIGKI